MKMWKPIPPQALTGKVAAPPALTPPAPLSPRERGEKDQKKLLFFSLISLGERRGRGGEGRRGTPARSSDSSALPAVRRPSASASTAAARSRRSGCAPGGSRRRRGCRRFFPRNRGRARPAGRRRL